MSGTIISFDDGTLPSLSQVGGKALSLARMTKAGFNVPVGFTLSTGFFADWISGIVGSREWEAVIKATPRELPGTLGEVRRRFGEIPFTDIQLKALDEATRGLHPAKFFAVRSSSPEEDLESASFAGEYETLLGVTGDKLIEAISTCALSCISERLILYKQKHGFNIRRPQIAVIVQRQVKSEKAGVAFSLNPINNCYDECVINANFGIGESVVSGGVTPDQFVVDKVGLRVVERRLGSKAFSLEIEDQGLIQREKWDLDGAFCLTEDEIIELTEIVSQIEELYGRPVDVEWAFAGGKLFILQARPVTAYFPLPESMRTKPGEQKRVYLDGTLTKLGMNDPMSVMGGDLLEIFGREFLRHQTGLDLYRLNEGIYESACGRSYVNLSNILKLGGRHKLSAAFRSIDTIAASIVETLDEKEYRATSFPRAIVTPRIFKVLRLVPAFLLRFFGTMKNPAKAHACFKGETEAFSRRLPSLINQGSSLLSSIASCTRAYSDYFFREFAPPFAAAGLCLEKIGKMFHRHEQAVQNEVTHLSQALPHNCTIEMGLALFALSRFEEIRVCNSKEEFARRIGSRDFPPKFLKTWDQFMDEYGHRCPNELDIATPRFSERPGDLFWQLKSLSRNTGDVTNPKAVFEGGLGRRAQAFTILLEKARGFGKDKKLKRHYEVITNVMGYRELPKSQIVAIFAQMRVRALSLGRMFVEQGRLDHVDEVFDLTVADADMAASNPDVDLRGMVQKNAAFKKSMKSVRHFPRVIDSRGRILRAPQKTGQPGELIGEPISPGVIRGRVKVLLRPDEKEVLPGEILVTRATDPGWTTLFLNAAGIVLEVGGVLQHGALVAREYCKPCVAGIEGVASLLKDGDLVEVDGSLGIIRVIGK